MAKKLEVIKLDDKTNSKLLAATLNSELAKIVLESYLAGAKLEDRNFTLRGEFTLEEVEAPKENK